MAWDIEVNPYMHLAVTTLWGRVSVAERAQALDALLARMEPGRPYRLLYDLIGAHAAPDCPHDVAAFVQRLAREAGGRGWRVAYLFPAGSRARQLVQPLSAAPQFAYRQFNAMNEAMDWLLAPAPKLEALPPVAVQAPPQPQPEVATAARRRLARWFG